MNKRKTIFICYSHKDKKWFDKIMLHLGVLKDQGLIDAWSDQNIEIGSIWNEDIQERIAHAKAAILLVSPHFLKSDYIRGSEVPKLLSKTKDSELKIFLLFLEPSLADTVPYKFPDQNSGPNELLLTSLQGLNDPNHPLSSVSINLQNSILLKCAKEILKFVKED